MLEQKIMWNPATSDYEEPHTDRDNGQLNRRHIQSTLLYSLDHRQTKDMRPEYQTIYHRQFNTRSETIRQREGMDHGSAAGTVGPSMKAEVQLTSAGPVYAFACNPKIITTATYFPFGNLALGRTSEHVYMQRSSKVRASQCVALRRATPSYMSRKTS
jgi:hypothetical protein